MKLIRTFMCTAVVLTLASCAAGVNFVKPASDRIVVGVTTKENVIAMMGQPNFKGQKVSNGETLDTITYSYAKVGGDSVFPGVTPARAMGFVFHKSILVGVDSTSSFKSDSTYFDVEKAKTVKQGMTKDEVEALLGKAGGEYRYPLIAAKDGKTIVYLFTQTKGFSTQQNTFIAELDNQEKVIKTEFNQFGQL